MVAGALVLARQVALRDLDARIFDARIHAVAVGTPLIARMALAPGKRSESEKLSESREFGWITVAVNKGLGRLTSLW